MKRTSRFLSLLLAAAMLLTLAPTAMAEGAKYTTTTTAEGWIKVVNEGGVTLGYSPDSGVTLLEVDGYAFKDSNRNGELDAYEDWRLDTETRAADLAAQLPVDQIAGLMLLSTNGGRGQTLSDAWKADMQEGVRTYDGSAQSVEDAVTITNEVQAYAESLPYAIPVEFHAETGSSMSVKVGTAWPEPLAIGATFNPEYAEAVGNSKGLEYRAVGITTVNSPQIDLATEPRWSRISGTFTEDPQLGADMAAAYANGLQSTYAEDGTDLGWGTGSVNATLKHFPGNGPAEGGREAHNDYGKFVVYNGDQFETQLIPFQAALELDGLTGSAASVMPDYSIGLDEDGDPIGEERVASAFNSYTITEVLRGEMGFEGMVVTDYDVINMRGWGVETLTETERCFKVIEAGCDKIGSYDQVQPIRDAFQMYADKYGEEAMEERVRLSAKRILVNMIHLGLLDNPYLELSVSNAIVNSDEREDLAYQAQLDSIVMVKNSTNLIQERSSKPTVYIPMEYTAATAGNESSAGSAASAGLPIDSRTAAKYFNVVTDTLATTYTGPADEDGNPTLSEADIIRASEEDIAACDFVLLFINNPSNSGGGYDSTTGEYLPISLQYGTYTANGIYVSQTSLGGDQEYVEVQDTYGAQQVLTTENRSYYGNTAVISNANELDPVHYYSSISENVVVVISATNPMIFSEFESEVETILMQFGGVSEEALCEVIGGQYEPKGLLPLQMPADMNTVEAQYSDVPRDMECHVDSEGNKYDFAFGMNWSGVIDDERVQKYSVPAIEYYDEYVK